MKSIIEYTLMFILFIGISGCSEDSRKEIKRAKDGLNSASKMFKESKDIESRYEKLKALQPLKNDQLKSWLPEKLGEFNRTGFKVGQAGFVNVASIEGTFNHLDGNKKFKVQVIDGAGSVGSGVVLSVGFANTVEMEEENDRKHVKTIKYEGSNARQTFYKQKNTTDLQFLVDERFSVTINAKNMEPDHTWQIVELLNLDRLKGQ